MLFTGLLLVLCLPLLDFLRDPPFVELRLAAEVSDGFVDILDS
jgi:hypothetical protein